mmetsp:Transcript_53854/g.143309  ORF Transcript_53854/g.143309 Transcript_53854/m.143309 type:complete len:582 (+) Transcript_53854:54-1799(+)
MRLSRRRIASAIVHAWSLVANTAYLTAGAVHLAQEDPRAEAVALAFEGAFVVEALVRYVLAFEFVTCLVSSSVSAFGLAFTWLRLARAPAWSAEVVFALGALSSAVDRHGLDSWRGCLASGLLVIAVGAVWATVVHCVAAVAIGLGVTDPRWGTQYVAVAGILAGTRGCDADIYGGVFCVVCSGLSLLLFGAAVGIPMLMLGSQDALLDPAHRWLLAVQRDLPGRTALHRKVRRYLGARVHRFADVVEPETPVNVLDSPFFRVLPAGLRGEMVKAYLPEFVKRCPVEQPASSPFMQELVPALSWRGDWYDATLSDATLRQWLGESINEDLYEGGLVFVMDGVSHLEPVYLDDDPHASILAPPMGKLKGSPMGGGAVLGFYHHFFRGALFPAIRIGPHKSVSRRFGAYIADARRISLVCSQFPAEAQVLQHLARRVLQKWAVELALAVDLPDVSPALASPRRLRPGKLESRPSPVVLRVPVYVGTGGSETVAATLAAGLRDTLTTAVAPLLTDVAEQTAEAVRQAQTTVEQMQGRLRRVEGVLGDAARAAQKRSQQPAATQSNRGIGGVPSSGAVKLHAQQR